MCKSWERYGIHAIESVYPILGPGYISARNTGSKDQNVVHLKHKSGADVIAVTTYDMYGGFGVVTLAGTAGHVEVTNNDSFYAFRAQLVAFIKYLRTGERPFPFEETIELMKIIIAGIRSRDEGGREVMIDEIKSGSN